MIDLEVQLTRESRAALGRTAAALRQHADGKALRRELTRALRAGADPVLQAVKQAALALPSSGRSRRGLRRKIAAASSVQVRTGARNPSVSVRVTRRRMGDQAAMPKSTNLGTWRHPVFGNRNEWVTQTSRKGWFDETAQGIGRREVQQELLQSINQIAAKLR